MVFISNKILLSHFALEISIIGSIEITVTNRVSYFVISEYHFSVIVLSGQTKQLSIFYQAVVPWQCHSCQ